MKNQTTSGYLGTGLLTMALVTGMAARLNAQYPLLPPETNGNANYEWRPDLGGWLDRQAKLVWGYGMTESLGSNYSYAGAQNACPNYPTQLAGQVQRFVDLAAYYDAQTQFYQESDPARSQHYAELAQWNRDTASAYQRAAADAAQYTNWRAPTLGEFQTAWGRGLFSRGSLNFNMDMSPAEGYDAGYQNLNWTSNPVSKNKKTAVAFSLGNGGSGSISVTSSINAQVVRTYIP